MRYEWRPETPEEIAEHQRMRRELLESREMNDKKNEQNIEKQHAHSPSILIFGTLICFLIYCLFKR